MPFAAGTVIPSTGKAIIANRILGSGTEPKYVAMGTGATGATRTAAVGDTALSTEVETRTSGTSSRVTTSVTNDTYQVVGTVTASTTRSVDEMGLFDASSTGNLFFSATHAVVGLSNGDSLQYTAKTQFT